MENTTKGSYLVDSDGYTYWSPTGAGAAASGSTNMTSSSEGEGQLNIVEQFTGELTRNDSIPRKPVASMSYGQRVRIARLFESHEEFVG